ncbi:DeoR/GlpR transcriptional regulator [Saccharopolyspora sp. HNM0983]|uniref:Lactose phosphotransferase system repressor n=1 Tax=Saccharopolyspora montiporae TaxID=2781240 RepID=A0A929G0B6_9PSEU|nr:DeoR/GlpR family DNA-binding transcription regulator [Saccharopolyspora sp. HNM0983]MBE9375174.1 DeoR/GlpR transcriptional regulator [Saccharopolyspora sp. HNM0983]
MTESEVPQQAGRRERIRREALDSGFVRIEQLAADHGVSTMTIHRDLDVLEQQGWVRKVRGGASSAPNALLEGSVRTRMADAAAEKSRLAEHALDLVAPGQVVAIDDSTTALAVADGLPERGPCTVVTNFLSVINRLSGEPGIQVIGLGGDYRSSYDAFLGLHTADMATTLRSDVLFMSTTAVVDGHCLHRSQETIQVKRALMRTAAHRVLLVDHTKFERRALHELAPLTEFDLVLSDPGLPQTERAALVEAGVNLRIAE